ncbi:hypothetical protein ACFYOV_03535 [Streptomyces sp. NPDC005931]|uniref:hypothetical protein n=1 Tax=Streptomyces sp. NPDC005931 TaxID=3364737 RepID=UPI0036C9889E
MHPETHLALHHARLAEARAAREVSHLAAAPARLRHLRSRIGWALVEIGLRMAVAHRAAVALPRRGAAWPLA